MVLGIAGSPGSGKTTLARAITERVNGLAGDGVAVHVPMDGFHLANASLDALGRRDRKGAIDTFDAWGYLGLLQRLLAERDHAVFAPAFERSVDEPVAGSIAVGPETRLVVTEGNYLLVDAEPWSGIPSLLAESWFVATPRPSARPGWSTGTPGTAAHRRPPWPGRATSTEPTRRSSSRPAIGPPSSWTEGSQA